MHSHRTLGCRLRLLGVLEIHRSYRGPQIDMMDIWHASLPENLQINDVFYMPPSMSGPKFMDVLHENQVGLEL